MSREVKRGDLLPQEFSCTAAPAAPQTPAPGQMAAVVGSASSLLPPLTQPLPQPRGGITSEPQAGFLLLCAWGLCAPSKYHDHS